MPDQFLIIIGAMKSGTTSLYQYLSQHPELAECADSSVEPSYFAYPEIYQRGRDWYDDLWDWKADQHRYAIEASTAYTKYPEVEGVASRIAESEGKFRFIYILRDPIDRICSHCRHLKTAGDIPTGWGVLKTLKNRESLLNVSRYSFQLGKFDRYFDRQDFFVTTSERLAQCPREVLADILEQFDLRPHRFRNVNHIYNQGKAVEAGQLKLFEQLRKIGPIRDLVRKYMPLRWREHIKDLFAAQDNESFREQLSIDTQEEIVDELSDDLRALKADSRLRIEHWSTLDLLEEGT
jgi:hypothetical protein